MKRIIGIFIALFTLGLFSCNNEKVDVPIEDELMLEKSAEIALAEVQVEATSATAAYEVEFFANAEETLSQWWKIGKRFGWRNANKTRYHKHAPDVTIELDSISENGYPKTITLNYGDNTVLQNGKVLSGKIDILITAPRETKNYSRTVTYTDFCRDSVCMNGTSVIEVARLDSTFRQFTSNLTITLPDETVITRSSQKVWQWLAGLDTEEDQTDDVYTISGTAEASMPLSDGTIATYVKRIESPLIKMKDCKYIVQGIVEIELNGDVICTMNYGEGDCDEFATMINADGETEVDLSERKMKGKNEKKQQGNGNNQGGKGNGNG